MIINIDVKNKIASLTEKAIIVCGNSDYIINFSFDEEWAEYKVKTARFFFNGKYTDVIFEGNECPAPIINKAMCVFVGVYAGELRTSTPAYIVCEKSILCNGGVPADPTPDVYTQIMERLNHLDGGGLTEEEIKAIVAEELKNIEVGGGLTEDEAREIVAEETEGKFTPSVESVTTNSSHGGTITYLLWGANPRYAKIQVSKNLEGNGIVVRDTYNIITADAIKDDHAPTFKQLKEYTAPIIENTRRIENLESTLLTYVEDTATAYEKAVPVGVGKYAILSGIGGASYTSKNAFNPALLDSSKYAITEDGGIKLKNAITAVPTQEYYNIKLGAGTWYISASGEGYLPEDFAYYDENGYHGLYVEPLTFTAEKEIQLTWFYSYEGVWEKPFYIMLSQTEGATFEPYFTGLGKAPVTEVVSKDTNSNVLQNIPIPTQIQALAHYGEAYTYIDFDNKQFVDEGYTFILDGTESFGYYKYGTYIGVLFQAGKYWLGGLCPHISTEGTILDHKSNSMWVGYGGGKTSYWLGILDILGYTSEWADRLNPTAEEKADALAKFKQYVKNRYDSGNPITIRQQVQGDDITYTDISAYLTGYDGYKVIEVQAGGKIVCENANKYAIPSVLTYVKAKV